MVNGGLCFRARPPPRYALRMDMNSTATQAAIIIDGLGTTYAGGKRALDDVTLRIPRG